MDAGVAAGWRVGNDGRRRRCTGELIGRWGLGGRVSVPALYAPASLKWSTTQYEYDLPSYIDEDAIQPQYQAPMLSRGRSYQQTRRRGWICMGGVWSLLRRAGGKLRFAQMPTNTAGRIIYWVTPTKFTNDGADVGK